MATRYLHGTLVFKVSTLLILVIASSRLGTGRVYAAPWFTTYGGGVLSGYISSVAPSVVTSQPPFPATNVFTSTLVQPGIARPILMAPLDNDTYRFSYGGIFSSGGYAVFISGGTTSTVDAYARNIGVLGGALPDPQRFVDVAVDVDVSGSCTCANILKSCNLGSPTVKIYKADLSCINTALGALNGVNYTLGSSGLVVLVQKNISVTSGNLAINYPIKTSATDRRLAIVTNRPIIIASGVGTIPATQAGYISQVADIQAMLITTFNADPSIEVLSGSARSIKIEGPLISRRKMHFRRDADTVLVKWPGVFVQYNPFYIAKLAELAGSLNIFGPSTAKWSYE